MRSHNRATFFDYAKAVAIAEGREACALLHVVKGREMLFTCRNLSEDRHAFIIDPRDYAEAERLGEIVAVIHSHVLRSPAPSEADRVSCEASGLPWHIVSVPNGTWETLEPSGYKAPLIGREFSHGVLDCYALVRDYYKENLGADLPEFERRPEWWSKGDRLLVPKNFRVAGFRAVTLDEIATHDVLVMQILADVPNHVGVYLGDDVFLHHLSGRLSSRDLFAGYYRKHCVQVLRFDP